DAVALDTAGVGNAEALREVDALYADNAVRLHHPSYVAHLHCPLAVAAVPAQARPPPTNASAAPYHPSEVPTLLPRRPTAWPWDPLGFADGDGIFTSGGTQSNLQALFLARENVLAGLAEGRTAGTAAARAGGAGDAPTDTGDARAATGDAPADGGSATRRGGPSDRPPLRDRLFRLRILPPDQAHFSLARAAFLLGLDAEAVVTVPTDAAGRMDAEALRASLLAIEANGAIPMAVVATAGTTDLGV